MRTLLTTTAAMLIGTGALLAQQATDTAAPTAAPATGTAEGTATTGPGLFLPSRPDALYASDVIGMDVYSSATDYATEFADDQPATSDARAEWDEIGEINDVMLSPAGDVQAVLVDIGGFLGMGAHTVALDMSQIHFLRDEGGARFAAVTSSREALQAAPAYERPAEQGTDPENADAAGAASGALGGQTEGDDLQAFVGAAGSSNEFEIKTSQLALERAETPEIRAFAQHMIEDHTAAGAKMQAAADSDNVAPPVGLAEEEEAQLEQLQAAPEGKFDAAYLAIQVAAHDEAVSLFETFARQDGSSALHAFAAETLPTLKEHQGTAHQLAGSM